MGAGRRVRAHVDDGGFGGAQANGAKRAAVDRTFRVEGRLEGDEDARPRHRE